MILKNNMKKIFGVLFILVGVVFSFGFINKVMAGSTANFATDGTTESVTIRVDDVDINSDGVKIRASGTIKAGTYHFSVFEEASYPNNRTQFKYAAGPTMTTVSTPASGIEAIMSGLKPSTRYVAVMYKDNYDTFVDTHFETLADLNSGEESVSVSDITQTSAKVVAKGLIDGNTYDIYLTGDSGKTPNDTAYSKSIAADVVDGTASTSFTGLKAGNNYVAYLVKNNDTSSFLGRSYFTVPSSANANAAATPDTLTNTKDSIYKGGIVPECNTGEIDTKTGQYKNPCNFNYLMILINSIIKFLLFTIATPLVALIIMYTGYLFITAGGNAGQTEKVRHILFNAVVGYIIALAAWLIINTIVSSLNVDPKINTFLQKDTLVK